MDITKMDQFEDSTFDLVIDKGSFDGLLCDEYNGTLMAAIMLNEV